MRFDTIMAVRNPKQWKRSATEVYKDHIDLAVLAEKLGYYRVWTSEHHFTEDGWSPSQLPLLAAVAARTERIRLGTGVLLLPFHNPIRLAEDAATVDILSNGRLDFGAGPGSHPGEFKTFGLNIKHRRPRMYEELEIIKRCFTEESFDWKGRFYEFHDVRMTTKPVQKPLPIFIGAAGPKALFEAGAHGYNMIGAGTADRRKLYEDGLRSAGHDPKKTQRAIMENFHVAETHDKAWDEAEAHLHYAMSWHYAMFLSDEGMKTTHSDIDFNIPPVGELRKSGRSYFGQAMIGSVEEVAKMLERRVKEAEPSDVVVSMSMPGMDPRAARNSLELFAKEVMPHFRDR